MVQNFDQFTNTNTDKKKINLIKSTLKQYQKSPEYKSKGQFDLDFNGETDPIGVYEFENNVFVITADGMDRPIRKFDSETIDEIYKQVCKN